MKSQIALLASSLPPVLAAAAVLWGAVRFRQLPQGFLATWARALVPATLFLAAMLPKMWLAFTAQMPGGGPAVLFATAVVVPFVALELTAVVGLWGETRILPSMTHLQPDGRGIGWGVAAGVLTTLISFVLYFAVEGLPEIQPSTGHTEHSVFGATWYADQLSSNLWGPFQEELVSRGLLLGVVMLLSAGRRPWLWAGILGTSFLWAAGHTHQWDAWAVRVAWLTGEGCIYAALTIRFDLESSLACHVTSNVLATILPFLLLLPLLG